MDIEDETSVLEERAGAEPLAQDAVRTARREPARGASAPDRERSGEQVRSGPSPAVQAGGPDSNVSKDDADQGETNVPIAPLAELDAVNRIAEDVPWDEVFPPPTPAATAPTTGAFPANLPVTVGDVVSKITEDVPCDEVFPTPTPAATAPTTGAFPTNLPVAVVDVVNEITGNVPWDEVFPTPTPAATAATTGTPLLRLPSARTGVVPLTLATAWLLRRCLRSRRQSFSDRVLHFSKDSKKALQEKRSAARADQPTCRSSSNSSSTSLEVRDNEAKSQLATLKKLIEDGEKIKECFPWQAALRRRKESESLRKLMQELSRRLAKVEQAAEELRILAEVAEVKQLYDRLEDGDGALEDRKRPALLSERVASLLSVAWNGASSSSNNDNTTTRYVEGCVFHAELEVSRKNLSDWTREAKASLKVGLESWNLKKVDRALKQLRLLEHPDIADFQKMREDASDKRAELEEKLKDEIKRTEDQASEGNLSRLREVVVMAENFSAEDLEEYKSATELLENAHLENLETEFRGILVDHGCSIRADSNGRFRRVLLAHGYGIGADSNLVGGINGTITPLVSYDPDVAELVVGGGGDSERFICAHTSSSAATGTQVDSQLALCSSYPTMAAGVPAATSSADTCSTPASGWTTGGSCTDGVVVVDDGFNTPPAMKAGRGLGDDLESVQLQTAVKASVHTATAAFGEDGEAVGGCEILERTEITIFENSSSTGQPPGRAGAWGGEMRLGQQRARGLLEVEGNALKMRLGQQRARQLRELGVIVWKEFNLFVKKDKEERGKERELTRKELEKRDAAKIREEEEKASKREGEEHEEARQARKESRQAKEHEVNMDNAKRLEGEKEEGRLEQLWSSDGKFLRALSVVVASVTVGVKREFSFDPSAIRIAAWGLVVSKCGDAAGGYYVPGVGEGLAYVGCLAWEFFSLVFLLLSLVVANKVVGGWLGCRGIGWALQSTLVAMWVWDQFQGWLRHASLELVLCFGLAPALALAYGPALSFFEQHHKPGGEWKGKGWWNKRIVWSRVLPTVVSGILAYVLGSRMS